MKKVFLSLFLLCLFPLTIHAQELIQDEVEIIRAKVIEVVSQEKREVPGTDVQSVYQTIKAEILEGDKKGDLVTIENDFLVLEKGDKFFLRITTDGLSKKIMYSVRELRMKCTTTY